MTTGSRGVNTMKPGILFVTVLSCVLCGTLFSNPGVLSAAGGALECQKQIASAVVHSTAVGLGGILKNVENETDRISIIRDFIDQIRFYPDQSGYFYVYDFDCVNIAHATQKDLPGKNLRDYKDVKGKYVIRELAAAAEKGGGFVEYYWVRPGFKGEHLKIGYVEPIPDTPYFIGTGVYLEGQ